MTTDSIPEHLRPFVDAELASGRYASFDDLVMEGLRVLCEHEQLFRASRESIRARVAEGVAQAERGELIDGAEAMEDIDRRLEDEFGRGV